MIKKHTIKLVTSKINKMVMKKVLLVIILITINSFSLKSGTVKSKIIINDNIDYIELYNTILETGVLHPDIAFAQAILESAHFKSSLFIRANNLFGMQLPTKRSTTAVGSTNGYSKYKTWHHSVLDYKLWQDSLFNRRGVMSRDQYFNYISKWYAEDKNYVNKIKNSIQKYKHIIKK